MSNVGPHIVQAARILVLRAFPVVALGVVASLSLSSVAFASDEVRDEASSVEPDAGSEHGEASAQGEGAASAQGHVPHFSDINWASGLIGEREGVEPGLLFRPEGMPPPLLATILNAAVLFAILIYFGRGPVAELLRKRKEEIMRGMQDAARMKEEADRQLADYEAQLAGMQERIEKARQDIRRAGELERERVVSEAKQRRERMEQEARRLVDQELESARAELMRRAVRAAAARAEVFLVAQVTAQDRSRLVDAYLKDVGRVPGIPGVQP